MTTNAVTVTKEVATVVVDETTNELTVNVVEAPVVLTMVATGQQGIQGEQGPQGDRGVDGTHVVVMQVPVGRGRAVTATGEICSKEADNLALYLGVTTEAVESGKEVVVRRSGILDFEGESFIVGQALLIGVAGVLVQSQQTPPLRRVGIAITPERVNLDTFPIIE